MIISAAVRFFGVEDNVRFVFVAISIEIFGVGGIFDVVM